jgi:hypothetical protein
MVENSGWYCPGCKTYHAPSVETCTEKVYDTRPIRQPHEPYVAYMPALGSASFKAFMPTYRRPDSE